MIKKITNSQQYWTILDCLSWTLNKDKSSRKKNVKHKGNWSNFFYIKWSAFQLPLWAPNKNKLSTNMNVNRSTIIAQNEVSFNYFNELQTHINQSTK